MRIDLENSPWAAVLVVALVCLVVLTLAGLLFNTDASTILGMAGVWAGLIVSALTAGAARGRRNGDGTT